MLTEASAAAAIAPLSNEGELPHRWNELLQSSDANCLFLTWEWINTWWKHLGGRRKWSVLGVQKDNALTGLAPLCTQPRCFRRGQFLHEAVFLGSGLAGADYLDMIIRRGHEDQACELLSQHLVLRKTSARWNNLCRGASSAEAVARRMQRKGWSLVEAAVNVCPWIPLHGHTWESYLATLGSEHRYAFNRKWKKLNRDFTVRLEGVRDPKDCAAAMDTLIRLHRLRWQTRGGSDAFKSTELMEFHREFAAVALARGWLRLYQLTVNEKPAAALYGFLYERKFYFFQSGLNPDFEKYSVGLILMGLSIRSAIEEGAQEYDLLHGDEVYKRHWARSVRILSRLELYPPGVPGWSQKWTKRLARSTGRMLTRGRRRFVEPAGGGSQIAWSETG
ncbi:MAG: GNAT family N-acetyltransferase [Bryobacterales bacterium]|nr:GNAT family N-acetyltransferase [Bryobacterales bacterium]MBV9401765.1 GNAT family N-acetyltransferase [Bryobacterales bacterium]